MLVKAFVIEVFNSGVCPLSSSRRCSTRAVRPFAGSASCFRFLDAPAPEESEDGTLKPKAVSELSRTLNDPKQLGKRERIVLLHAVCMCLLYLLCLC